MNHTCITIEGGLLAPDFLETIADAEGQKASDFGLTGRRTLVDEVSAIWSDVRSYWDAFQRRLERSTDESRTTVTREQWMIPLLEALGYSLTHHRSGIAINGRNYVISHRTGDSEEDLPVDIEAYDQDLGSRPASGRGTMSPHAMLQDYLNRTEHLWAIVTNGSTLRLLRDSSYFTRPSFIEFDLKQMLEGERLDEFFLFYRLVHRTRLPRTQEDGDACLLEKYHQLGIEQGGRIRDGLRDAVTNAIIGLGRGFLQHRKNEALRDAVVSGRLTPQQYYQQILYLIYRLLFLMVAEERNLLRCDGELPAAAVEARRFFTLGRLRDLATEALSAPERFDDLYLNLQALFLSLCKEDYAAKLGLPPLNGELFDCGRTSDIGTAYLDNATLLRAIRGMSYFTSREERVPRRVNYGALDVEELGSVYESLLDFQPLLRHDDGRFTFDLGTGTERKTTGSYYTRPELVQELIKSALEPVIADRLQAAKPDQREDALLGLKVCDPACGSGHFLLAAARRIGTELARVRTGEEAPAPDAVREAVRDVITHCIYGVDKNPLAVDLCKVALWIEGHSGGKPLTFLDHRIRCGDSLVGVFDLSVLEDGIPDAAFDPVSGDDRKFASAIKKRNKEERTGQQGFAFDTAAEVHDLVEERRELETLHDDTPEDIHRKRAAWERLQRDGGPLWRERMACHLWTAAFFAELTPEAEENRHIPTTADLRRFVGNPDSVDARLRGHVWAVAERNRFFHWPLEFPEVFEQGGFDCVLSNPPWEEVQPEEASFFAGRGLTEVAALAGSRRKTAIDELAESHPSLYADWVRHQRDVHTQARCIRSEGRFPLTAVGKLNQYALFADVARQLSRGRAGVVVPTGIATDDSTKTFFGSLMAASELASLFDFQNRERLFTAVAPIQKFCLLTLSASPVESNVLSFFMVAVRELGDAHRRFSLTHDEMRRLNPNTGTCPLFRTGADATLTTSIYSRVPILDAEAEDDPPWQIALKQGLFNSTTDSHLFWTLEDLQAAGCPSIGNRFTNGSLEYLPVYEAKLLNQYDHRQGTFAGTPVADRFKTKAATVSLQSTDKQDPCQVALPRYWVEQPLVEDAVPDVWKRQWYLCYRRIVQMMTNARCTMCAVLPRIAVVDTAPLIMPRSADAVHVAALLASLNSLFADYAVRQKIGGAHVDFHHLKQLPVPKPDTYTAADLLFVVPRVVELTYTSWDIKAFADDVWREGDDALRQALQQQWEANHDATGGHEWDPPEWAEIAADGCPLPPFKWSDDRRAVLRAELDAWYARLYGLTRKQLRYILDPHGLSERELEDILDPWEDPTCQGPHLLPAEPAEDFPGETFRVLKDKDEAAYGEYRTRRLVLEAWERQREV